MLSRAIDHRCHLWKKPWKVKRTSTVTRRFDFSPTWVETWWFGWKPELCRRRWRHRRCCEDTRSRRRPSSVGRCPAKRKSGLKGQDSLNQQRPKKALVMSELVCFKYYKTRAVVVRLPYVREAMGSIPGKIHSLFKRTYLSNLFGAVIERIGIESRIKLG